jgi:hypothetical protein
VRIRNFLTMTMSLAGFLCAGAALAPAAQSEALLSAQVGVPISSGPTCDAQHAGETYYHSAGGDGIKEYKCTYSNGQWLWVADDSIDA